MGLAQSYFALGDYHPVALLERLLHSYKPWRRVSFMGRELEIAMTARARKALAARTQPLQVEMQLYFSCVVQKRVLFHDGPDSGEQVDNLLALSFRPVEADSCDPVAFARNHPERRDFTSAAAGKMHPRSLRLDYKEEQWHGEFDI